MYAYHNCCISIESESHYTGIVCTVIITHFLLQMVNDTVLPNQVRFNVTIEHDLPSSIGSAHQMIISGGSDAFDVYWNDDRTGPSTTSPDFSVADDKIYTWTPDALGTHVVHTVCYRFLLSNRSISFCRVVTLP